jgi:hypothetical protein
MRAALRFLVLLICAISLSPSLAQAARAYEPSFAYERDHQSIVVAADGSYRLTQDRTVRIQTAAGIESKGVANDYYSADSINLLPRLKFLSTWLWIS